MSSRRPWNIARTFSGWAEVAPATSWFLLSQENMNESLIERVKNNEILFNVNSPDYRNQHMRQEAWEQIARDLNIDAETAKNGWDRLRRCYINALHRRRNKKNGQPSVKKTKWKYEKQMAFLLPFMEIYRKGPTIQTEGNLITTIHNDRSTTLVETKSQEVNSEYSHQPKCQDILKSQLNRESSTQTMTKQNSGEDKQERDTDETDMFFLSMSKMAKALPPLEQAKIKLVVSNTVFKSQMKFYERNGSGSSQSSIVDMECDFDSEPNQI